MILGVALPHYHITWFATKVLDRTIAPNEIAIPKNGEMVHSLQELKEKILEKIDRYTMKLKQYVQIGNAL